MEQNEQAMVAGPPLAVGPSVSQDAVLQHPMASPKSIDHIPVELVEKIFRYCIEPTPSATPPPLFENPTTFYDWIKVTHVCKLWRYIVLGSPRLWTSIQITPTTQKLADLFIQRSGTMDLRVIAPVFQFEEAVDPQLIEDCADIMDTVVRLSPRIESLTFIINTTDSEDEPVRGISTNYNLDFSRLTFLELISGADVAVPFADTSFKNLVPNGCPLPRLKTLMTDLEPQTYLPWLGVPSLETINIRCYDNLSHPEWDTVLQLLSLLENLETLVLTNFQRDIYDSGSLPWITIMPKLRCLDLSFSDVTWRIIHFMDSIIASPIRLTVRLGDSDDCQFLRNQTLHQAIPIMDVIGDRMNKLVSPAMLPLKTLSLEMSYRHSESSPEIVVRGSPSEACMDDPVLGIETGSIYTVKPFLLGTMPHLPFTGVTHLLLSFSFIEGGIFHNIRPHSWFIACQSMKSVHTLVLSGFPPLSFLSALGPGRQFLFPELRTIHLVNIDFYFSEDAPMMPWGVAFLKLLESRSNTPLAIERLRISNATNLTGHPTNICVTCVSALAEVVGEIHWDRKEQILIPDIRIHVDVTVPPADL